MPPMHNLLKAILLQASYALAPAAAESEMFHRPFAVSIKPSTLATTSQGIAHSTSRVLFGPRVCKPPPGP